ncbi:minor capsid protein [Fructobacillus sp. M1-13]|uniref:Minor capsid protein n=1 Tax=Fructobacillus papyriferae TaxID=2713171 RepID=A0ABS5QPJ5_9LACO|nr:minor capsid protein [Fructobacillus papyriferae]MBS9335006.1 minor capsid protein [Fructobacillus papyriferae]MCD2159508.1 minor capsid protein [Fructobacillus papyriferae]
MADKQSKSYWVQRELDHADDIKKSAGDQLKVLNKLYDQALDDITDDINRSFIRYAKGQGMTMDEAMKLADKTDVTRFVDKVKQYVADKDFSEQANSDLKIYNLKIRVSRLKLLQLEMSLEIDRLNGRITSSTEDYLTQQAVDEYKRQSTILGKSVAYSVLSAKQLVNAAYSLAGEGSYTFSTNIWKNTEQLKNKLNETLNKVILQGKNPNQFNKEFRDMFDVQPSQSGRLLITETARVQGDVQRDSYKQSGIDKYDIVYERRACQTCISIAKEGPYKLSEAEVGTNMYPFHPNCMCSIMPVLGD